MKIKVKKRKLNRTPAGYWKITYCPKERNTVDLRECSKCSDYYGKQKKYIFCSCLGRIPKVTHNIIEIEVEGEEPRRGY